MPNSSILKKQKFPFPSENADIVGASAEKDLNAWSAEKARFWHAADRRGEWESQIIREEIKSFLMNNIV